MGPGMATGTVKAALIAASARLKTAGVEDPARDARLLMAEALGVDPGRLAGLSLEPLPDPAAFSALIARRAAREPVSKILGRREFYGRSFRIGAAVLDPRPETELLVDLALAGPFTSVLDLGTGSGCILLSLLAERPGAQGLATDLSEAALKIARANAAAFGLERRASFAAGDWFAPVTGRFSLIVSNPPYIATSELAGLAPEVRDWDPPGALSDFGDGLGAYRQITHGAPAYLEPGGRLILEIGWQQADAVAGLLAEAGFAGIAVHQDLAGHDRVVLGQLPG